QRLVPAQLWATTRDCPYMWVTTRKRIRRAMRRGAPLAQAVQAAALAGLPWTLRSDDPARQRPNESLALD
ncbi:MAG: hypothetical protein M1482_10365, partial [Chloroflexi bacterium]|nr:hypothetical protein [Chloroflexota bacterium]